MYCSENSQKDIDLIIFCLLFCMNMGVFSGYDSHFASYLFSFASYSYSCKIVQLYVEVTVRIHSVAVLSFASVAKLILVSSNLKFYERELILVSSNSKVSDPTYTCIIKFISKLYARIY